MRRYLANLNERQRLLAGIAALTFLCAALAHHVVFPTYDRWITLRSEVQAEMQRHQQLLQNIAMKESIYRQFGDISEQAVQRESNEVTLSQCLHYVESLARHSSLTVTHIRPQDVEDQGAVRLYRVKVAVSGRLQEVTQFISGLTSGEEITGLESFLLRGVRGWNMVECSFCIRMIRLTSFPSAVLEIAVAGEPTGGSDER